MTEQTESYSIEIQDQRNEQLAVFTFADVTADELHTVLTEFQRLFARRAEAASINLLAPTRA